MNLPYYIPSQITIIGLIILFFIFIYETVGLKSILLLIPIYLYVYRIIYTDLVKKNKILIESEESNFLFTLDNYIFKNYKKIEKRFYDIYDEYKEFKNNRKYYKSLLIDNKKEMEFIIKSFSLSTFNHEEEEKLNKIYNNWYNNIQSMIDNI